MKKIIKLTESELHNIVKNTVNKVLIREYQDDFAQMMEDDINDYVSKYSDILDNVENTDDDTLLNAINDYQTNKDSLEYDKVATQIFNMSDNEYAIRNKKYAMSHKEPVNYHGGDASNRNVKNYWDGSKGQKRFARSRFNIGYDNANRELNNRRNNYLESKIRESVKKTLKEFTDFDFNYDDDEINYDDYQGNQYDDSYNYEGPDAMNINLNNQSRENDLEFEDDFNGNY